MTRETPELTKKNNKNDNIRENIFKEEPASSVTKKVIFIITASLALSGAFGAIAGVLFQKGMFIEANLGNIDVNTSLHNLAFDGFYSTMFLFSRGLENFTFKNLSGDIFWVVIFLTIISIIAAYFILYGRKTIFPNGFEEKKIKTRNVLESNWLFLILPVLINLIVIFVRPIIILIILIPLIFLSAFGIYGQKSGQEYLRYYMNNSPCVYDQSAKSLKDRAELNKDSLILTCAEFKIGKKSFKGYIMVNNNDGYLILQKNNIVYVSKDGERCFFSYFSTSKSILDKIKSNNDNFFEKDEMLEKYCANNLTHEIS